jgi:hypothetical protein
MIDLSQCGSRHPIQIEYSMEAADHAHNNVNNRGNAFTHAGGLF